jgi:hypothetical protein
MTAIILPPSGGGGVTIYPNPSDLPAIASVGQIAAVASDVTVRQWDGATWRVVSSPSSPVTVDNTASVNLTVTAGELTADLNLSAAAADAGFQAVTLSIETDGLQGQIADTAIRSVLSVSDTNSINAAYDATNGVFSADLILSVQSAGTGFQDVTLAILADGLAAAIADTEIRSVLSASNTDSIDMSYDAMTGDFLANLNLSASAPDAGFQAVTLSIELDGLQGQVADADIRSVLSATSPLAYNATTGDFSIADQNANLVLAGPATGIAAPPTFRSLVVADIPTGIDHGGLDGLGDDDHTQYALLAGRAGGQTLIGGTAAGEDLTLQSTSNATRGSVILADEAIARGALRKTNNTTNASFVSGVAAEVAFATATDGQAAIVTMTAGFNSFAFLVSLSTGESLLCYASNALAEISAVSDPSGLFLLTDAGVGIYVSKSSSSSVLSIKNRMGGSRDIGVTFLSGQISSATAWA